jgi:hypothetical protein
MLGVFHPAAANADQCVMRFPFALVEMLSRLCIFVNFAFFHDVHTALFAQMPVPLGFYEPEISACSGFFFGVSFVCPCHHGHADFMGECPDLMLCPQTAV